MIFYNGVVKSFTDGEINFANDDIKIMFTNGDYEFNVCHSMDDVICNEVIGKGYPVGGFSPQGRTVVREPNIIKYKANNLMINDLHIMMYGLVIYKYGTCKDDSLLISYEKCRPARTDGSVEIGWYNNTMFEIEV